MEENNQQIQTPQQSVQQVSNIQAPSSPKSKRKFIIIGFVIVVLLLIAGSSFAAYQFVKEPQTQKVACTLEAKICPDGSSVGRTGPNCSFAPCPTVTPPPDPTAGWKTYTNTQYGFEFKYPNYWYIASDSGKTITIGQKAVNGYEIFLTISTDESSFTNPNNYELCSQVKTGYCIGESENEPKQSIFPISIAGRKAYEFYFGGFADYSYRIIHINDPLIELKMDIAGGGLNRSFDQILSTFKFINSQTPSPTSSQKISCQTDADCPSGDTCTVWGPVRIDGPQNKYCTAPGQPVPL